MRKTYTKDRTERFHCRLTKDEKELIQNKAEEKGLTITDYLMQLVAKDK